MPTINTMFSYSRFFFLNRRANLLRKNGDSPVFYPLLIVGHLSSLKDVTPTHLRCGVYRVDCNAPGCNAAYIGQSGRAMSDRISEHMNFVKKKNLL